MTTLAVISTAASSADATGGANVASMLTMLIPLALIIVFFYFFIIRPEKKRNKEMQNMLNSIQVADEVITNGGIIRPEFFPLRRTPCLSRPAATAPRSAC